MEPQLRIIDNDGSTILVTSLFDSTLSAPGDVIAVGFLDGPASTAASFIAPSTGTYYIEVTDQTGTGSADHFYFLEMRTEGP